jgi:hypothetical protein
MNCPFRQEKEMTIAINIAGDAYALGVFFKSLFADYFCFPSEYYRIKS